MSISIQYDMDVIFSPLVKKDKLIISLFILFFNANFVLVSAPYGIVRYNAIILTLW